MTRRRALITVSNTATTRRCSHPHRLAYAAFGLCLLGALSLSACSSTPASTQGTTAVKATVAAQPQGDILFSHALHLEQDVACTTCHQGLDQASKLSTAHLPSKKVCAQCHDVDDQDGCKTCHRDPTHPGNFVRRAPTEKIKFSHQAHLGRKIECVSCHTGVMVAASVESITRPKMRSECLSCHNHKQDYRNLQCEKCHDSLRDFPIRWVSQFTHDGDFSREHGRWASATADLCARCHRQTFCADCHSRRAPVLPSLKWPEQVGRDFVHRGDYLSRHAIDAQADPQMCTRCHSPKTCDSCHSARGVSSTAGRLPGNGSPHPADWMTPGSANGHGAEARRNIVMCASCHDQGAKSNCVRCHASSSRGGLGINPHPPGWDRGGQSSNQMCQFCH